MTSDLNERPFPFVYGERRPYLFTTAVLALFFSPTFYRALTATVALVFSSFFNFLHPLPAKTFLYFSLVSFSLFYAKNVIIVIFKSVFCLLVFFLLEFNFFLLPYFNLIPKFKHFFSINKSPPKNKLKKRGKIDEKGKCFVTNLSKKRLIFFSSLFFPFI